MATANSHISGALTKAASKKKPRKAKSDVIKKDSSGTATRELFGNFELALQYNHYNRCIEETSSS